MYKRTIYVIIVFCFLNACSDKKRDVRLTKKTESHRANIENGLLPGMVLKGDIILHYTLTDGMKNHKVPGVSIAVINDGKLDWAMGYGIANDSLKTKVDTTTLFQAASISKPITALAILKLMEQGKVNLDKDVNTYLKKWKVPSNKFTKQSKVTLRGLLTHSAGTTIHGFPGYTQNDNFPSTIDVLSGKGNTAIVEVDTIPGSQFKYSGGGYTIIQKVIEDITQTSFETYMDNNILRPLGMTHSTFAQPLPKSKYTNASAAYDSDGKRINGFWHNYPEKAAAGLWTTPTDLAKYIMEIQQILAGKTNGLLKPETVKQMLSKGKFEHGLGPGVVKEADSLLFVHGGKNEGFTNVFVAYANKGQGVVIMTNADNGGRLLGDIERSISKEYEWGLNKTEIIDPIKLSKDYLDQFSGSYLYVNDVPSAGGQYIIKARIENDQLVIFDVPENQDYHFVATDSLSFLDIQKNERVRFVLNEKNHVLWWNNSFEFKKIAN